MVSFSNSRSGRWFHPAGADHFHQAAKQYEAMVEKVEPAAASAVREHIVKPAIAAGAHQATDLYRYRGNLHVGVHPDHPDADAAADIEYGTETQPAGGHVRHAMRTHREETLAAFYKEMME